MKRIIGIILRFLVVWIGVIGSVASIYGIRNDIFTAIKDKHLIEVLFSTLQAPAVWIPALGSIPLVVFGLLVQQNLHKRGKVSIRKLFRRLNPIIFAKICIQIHQLEHQYQKVVDTIVAHRGQGGVFANEIFRNELFAYLGMCKQIIDLSTGSDNAMHIKLFEHRTENIKGTVPLKRALLRTYLRAPSRRECHLIDQQQLQPRDSSEVFRIIPNKQGLASTMIKKADTYQRSKFKHCSAYNHVFSDPEHYYLCNNISNVSKRSHFFSTSENYNLYYKSVCVFLINSHVPNGQSINHDPVWGLLIVDSFQTGIYEKFITKYLAGYMAHRCYGMFEYANLLHAI